MAQEPAPPSLRDIARRAGVSVATVSLALRSHKRISAQTRDHVQQVAAEMGYQPSIAMSQAMSAARSRGQKAYRENIACLSWGTTLNNFDRSKGNRGAENQNREFYRGIMSRTEELGCAVDFFSLNTMSLKKLLSIFRARGIERVIFVGQWVQYEKYQLVESLWEDFSIVTLGPRDVQWVKGAMVRLDYFAAGRHAFFEAWKAGYRRFFLHFSIQYLNTDRRFEAGFRFAAIHLAPNVAIMAMNDSNGLPDFEEIKEGDCVIGGVETDADRKLLEHLRKVNAGWLDWHANLRKGKPHMSGIDQNDFQQARAAVDLVLSLRSSPDTARNIQLIEPGWIDGETLPALRNDHLNVLQEDDYPDVNLKKLKPVDLLKIHKFSMGPEQEWMRDLSIPSMPGGTWIFHGIPFKCSTPAGEDGWAARCTLVGNRKAAMGRALPQVEIPIGKTCKELFLLHASAYSRREWHIATYHFEYADGQGESLPLLSLGDPGNPARDAGDTQEPNIQDYFKTCQILKTDLTRPACLLDSIHLLGNTGCFYSLRWKNPHPGKRIVKMTAQMEPGSKALLIILAVTLGQG